MGRDFGTPDVSGQLDPVTGELPPGFSIHGRGADGTFIRAAKPQANLLGWIAHRSIQLRVNPSLAGCKHDAGRSKVGGAVLETAALSGLEPFSGDGLAKQELISLFPHEELAEPAAGI